MSRGAGPDEVGQVSPVRTRVLSGREVLSHGEAIHAVYLDAFGGPPWHEGVTHADAYLSRLALDADRSGFLAVAAFAGDDGGDGEDEGSGGGKGRMRGFCTAWTTPSPFPGGRSYPLVAAALGPRRTADWLCGSQEIDEVAVRAEERGAGLGAALVGEVTRHAPAGAAWLMTSVGAESAVRFYRRLGWRQVGHPAPGGSGVAVFLGPDHPADLTF